MGIRKKQHTVRTPDTAPPAKPACIQRADTIRRKAQHYTNITEQTGKQCNDRHRASQQREQAEKEMAVLRAEALQARRLAAQIEELHQPPRPRRKGRIMSTTFSDPGQAQRMTRRETDSTPSTGSQLSFNPLHPSMELPPEQLIRLLGLENKTKRRKKRPASSAASSGKMKPAARAVDKLAKLTLPAIPPASAEREKDIASTPFEGPRRNLVAASLVVGTLAGIGLSIYLFWGSPDEATATASQKAPLQGTEKSLRQAPATRKAPSSIASPATAPVPATVESARQGTVNRANIISPADIEMEQARLRENAEKRFAERMLQQDIRLDREALTTQPAPAEALIPAPDSDATIAAENAKTDPEPVVVISEPASAPVQPAVAPAEAITNPASEPEPVTEDLPLSLEQEPAMTPVDSSVEHATDSAATQEPVYQAPLATPLEDEVTTTETGNINESERTTVENGNIDEGEVTTIETGNTGDALF
ncbi:hypothetical protein DFR30_0453 [Thiogranum longum]|uniref:Uncharacterized protein n=1 Tax=Thiogranum longum TaxID=1537524 RepID=A0A4R1HJ41_9GAMM|nr:hypothetical protein [Thiogranum longum]TCK17232.1 hypothetical protein DFR30_0453 [Thiogranum longum]